MIINTTTSELTADQKHARAKTRLLSVIKFTFAQMKRAYTDGMAIVWDNADGLTPADVFAALGTDGAEACRLSSVLATAINAAVPDTVPASAPQPLTINQDGTVTVGQ